MPSLPHLLYIIFTKKVLATIPAIVANNAPANVYLDFFTFAGIVLKIPYTDVVGLERSQNPRDMKVGHFISRAKETGSR